MQGQQQQKSGAGTALGIGLGAIGNAIGNIGAGRRNYFRQKKLLGLQFGHQQQLNKQAQELQFDLWNKTNYGAQVDHLDKAGLNVGLIYGQGGPGGTTGSGGGGNAAGGGMPNEQPLDIGSIVQAAQAAANIKLTKAQTEKVQEEARAEEISNEVRDFAGTEADKYEASNRRDAALSEGQILFEGKKQATNMYENLSLAEKEGFMQEMIGKEIENKLKNANIELTKERINQIWHEIRQRWAEVGVKGLGTVIQSIIAKGVVKKVGKVKGNQ